ncbi:CASP-like protein 4D1 [Ziziphus jujuba]|uniref:CASP-like protein n=1 Tax=Ziziphus jujuba TaxID=326968 RepID=A0ABM3IL25_ZIZJJ|nr:CASP-like protein 4D1 [Ziziphus jujuba]
MDTKSIAISTLVLRIFVLLSLIASAVVLVLDNYTLSDDIQFSFQQVIAYRYMLATAVIGAAYSIVQLPFAIYYASTEKQLIRNDFLPQFDFFADKIMSLLLASGVGAGYGVSFELKRFVNAAIDALEFFGAGDLSEQRSKDQQFLNKGIIATSILLLGCILMIIVSLLSSINRSRK